MSNFLCSIEGKISIEIIPKRIFRSFESSCSLNDEYQCIEESWESSEGSPFFEFL